MNFATVSTRSVLAAAIGTLCAVIAAGQSTTAPSSEPASQAVDMPATAPAPVKQSMRDLWRESIGSLAEDATPAQLLTAMRKVDQIQMNRKAPTALTPSYSQEVRVPTATTTSKPAEPGEATAEISPQIIEKIKKLTVKDVPDAAKLGDDLYTAGQLAAAAAFYELALKDKQADAAWVLFQLGNCKSKSDPVEAQTCYRKLKSEFATSPWVRAAEVRMAVIDWYATADPASVVAESAASQPSSQPSSAPASQPTTATAPQPNRS